MLAFRWKVCGREGRIVGLSVAGRQAGGDRHDAGRQRARKGGMEGKAKVIVVSWGWVC